MTRDMESSWTVEDELCRVAETTNIGQALYKFGLLNSPTTQFYLDETGSKWARGGAETYIYPFSVTPEGSGKSELLIKACVAFDGGTTIENILNGWVERRKLLAANGVFAPKLYGWGHGDVIEEFLPYSVKDVLLQSIEPPSEILDLLVLYTASLSKLGFAAISPFHDLRSHGSDVVVVDLGQDIGPPGSMKTPQPELFGLLCDYLQSIGIHLSSDLLDELRATFTINCQ
ncbi:MAG: hypothetical protein PHV74_06340 [Dehalococcoidia bacterium]|nr:hypothetical protein [Dehalococcoidia bacterium]